MKVRASLRNGRRDWYRITNLAEANSATIHVYDEIGYFGVTANEFVNEVKALQVDSITLHVNSPGGEVFDGIAIYNALRNHPANVTVIVDALAASIASVIAMAGDTVIMEPTAQLMIHDGHGICVGNAADMHATADLLDKCSDNIASVYATRTGTPVDAWRERMRNETWYSAQEAVDAGLADRVAGAEDSIPSDAIAPTAAWDLSIYSYAGRQHAPAPVIETPALPVPVRANTFTAPIAATTPDPDSRIDIDFAELFRGALEGLTR
jgi:ATP-dependent Clp endopeptidase proteolytic subunit ClpP